jgi:hypothetical protein
MSRVKPLHEVQNCVVEYVVLVAGDHVTGAGDIDIFSMRHDLTEMRDLGFADNIALRAAH